MDNLSSVAAISLLAALAACHNRSDQPLVAVDSHPTAAPGPAATGETPNPAGLVPAARPAGTGPAPSAVIDFEDEFAYGGPAADAGVADAGALAASRGRYKRYTNPRFGFHVDVPVPLEPMPEPTNGDGMQWRLGNLVVMTASGMNAIDGVAPTCASSSHVTAHDETATSCFATGKANGFIYWQREKIEDGVLYSLRLQYVEALKETMDPFVVHANASWTVGGGGPRGPMGAY